MFYKEDALITLPVKQSSFEKIKEDVFGITGNTEESRRILLACDEALTNIISYSGATSLSYSCEKVNDRLRIVFIDNGIAFDPTAAQTEERDFELLDSGGVGIMLMRESAESMHYERKNDRNILILYFSLTARAF
ncbi:MAG: ATP-binding protein [Lachnospiraceae bacterium]|nr:ATP-binding protein [Lachnospiraceae bacterium]